MSNETRRPPPDVAEKNGRSAESDAQGKAAPKTDERPPQERQAEADLLESSGDDPFTQESD